MHLKRVKYACKYALKTAKICTKIPKYALKTPKYTLKNSKTFTTKVKFIFKMGAYFLQKVFSGPVKWLKNLLVKKKITKKNFQKLKFNFEKGIFFPI